MPRRGLATASASFLLVGVGVAMAPAAMAADPGAPDTSTSHASAQFLSGIWNSDGAAATYVGDGSETAGSPQTDYNEIASITSGPDNIALGGEYASAGPGGSSWAASGQVTGAEPGDGTAGSASIDLSDELTAAGLDGLLSEFTLNLQQISSIAKLDAAQLGDGEALTNGCGDWVSDDVTNCRDYTLAAGDLELTSPAVATLYGQIRSLAQALDSAVGKLSFDISPDDSLKGLAASVAINSALSVAGTAAVEEEHGFVAAFDGVTATVTLSSNVADKLAELLGNFTFGGVHLDLSAGAVSVDLTTIIGDLNNLGPNTPLFDKTVFDTIATNIDAAIDAAIDKAVDAVMDLINAVQVDVSLATGGTVGASWNCRFIIFCDSASSDFTVTATYSGGLADVLTGNGNSAVVFASPSTESHISAVIDALNNAGFESGVPGLIKALTDNDFLSEGVIEGYVHDAVQNAADGLKSAVDAGADSLGDALRDLSDVFNGTINEQSYDPATGQYSVSALVLRFGADAAAAAGKPLRSAGAAFAAAPRPAAVLPGVPAATVRLATSVVGPNVASTQCADGQHYDPTAVGRCAADPTPPGGQVDPGNQGGPSTPGAPDGDSSGASGVTPPAIEVEGVTGGVINPAVPDAESGVEVQGVSEELVAEAPEELAATGPHEVGFMALLGLEVLLAGIAIMRLSARRGADLAVRSSRRAA